MSSVIQAAAEPPKETPAGWEKNIARFLDVLVFAAFAFVCGRAWLPAAVAHSAEAVFLIAAVGSILLALVRELPAQNVIFAAGLTALIGAAQGMAGFGSPVYSGAAGPRWFEVPWAVPFLWVLMMFTARGAARLLLRPWRQARAYGFAVIGLTVVLVLALDFGLQMFATRAGEYWSWPAASSAWLGAPPAHFLGTLGTALATAVLITPWMIRKKPGNAPANYQPVAIWTLLNLLFMSGAFVHQLWVAGAVNFVLAAAVAIPALRRN